MTGPADLLQGWDRDGIFFRFSLLRIVRLLAAKSSSHPFRFVAVTERAATPPHLIFRFYILADRF